ncbi:serine/threonine-protein kinase [Nocardiopsis baichengensis]|uniref:serine/threonine-protein kinase n=1 Tax=Nocardiopsis baichengensis TaxID=280240 RepID=UPI000344FB24|nr:serine/threonine-protein kinase [Nocardiopsis baichengensis]
MTARLLADRYRLSERIGRGGMGTVWRAEDEFLRRPVAVKEIRLDPGLDPVRREELVGRSLREARICAGLSGHPSIVTIHDVLLDQGRPWIVMELMEGRSLDRTVEEDGPLSPGRTAGIGRDLLSALETAHRGGVRHRDVKPGNVMLLPDGRAVLSDFGIAVSDEESRITLSGRLPGSPGYIAPERLRGGDDTELADVWSLGATLYYAVEGRPAYDGRAAQRLTAAMEGDPGPPVRAGPLRPALDGMLRRDPGRRLAGKALAGELERAARETAGQEAAGTRLDVSGELPAPDVRPPGRSTDLWWWPPKRRHWKRWIAAVFTLVLIPMLVNVATDLLFGSDPDDIDYGGLTDPPPGYTDTAHDGFTVMAPEHWIGDETQETLLLTAPGENTGLGMRSIGGLVAPTPEETLEEIEGDMLDGDFTRAVEITEVDHPDGEAARGVYEGDGSGTQMTASLVLVDTGDGVGILMFAGPAAEWPAVEEQHRTALESFRAVD